MTAKIIANHNDALFKNSIDSIDYVQTKKIALS